MISEEEHEAMKMSETKDEKIERLSKQIEEERIYRYENNFFEKDDLAKIVLAGFYISDKNKDLYHSFSDKEKYVLKIITKCIDYAYYFLNKKYDNKEDDFSYQFYPFGLLRSSVYEQAIEMNRQLYIEMNKNKG